MAGQFARVQTRRRARRFLFGLLADLPRKNCWSIAEHADDPDPHGMQYLPGRAAWDTDGVRDDLRDYVTTGLGDADGVLVVDEPGGADGQSRSPAVVARLVLRPVPGVGSGGSVAASSESRSCWPGGRTMSRLCSASPRA